MTTMSWSRPAMLSRLLRLVVTTSIPYWATGSATTRSWICAVALVVV